MVVYILHILFGSHISLAASGGYYPMFVLADAPELQVNEVGT